MRTYSSHYLGQFACALCAGIPKDGAHMLAWFNWMTDMATSEAVGICGRSRVTGQCGMVLPAITAVDWRTAVKTVVLSNGWMPEYTITCAFHFPRLRPVVPSGEEMLRAVQQGDLCALARHGIRMHRVLDYGAHRRFVGFPHRSNAVPFNKCFLGSVWSRLVPNDKAWGHVEVPQADDVGAVWYDQQRAEVRNAEQFFATWSTLQADMQRDPAVPSSEPRVAELAFNCRNEADFILGCKHILRSFGVPERHLVEPNLDVGSSLWEAFNQAAWALLPGFVTEGA